MGIHGGNPRRTRINSILLRLVSMSLYYRISVSGGAGSTLAAHLAVEQRGAENCCLVFADTGSEHADTYAMVKHMFETALPEVPHCWIRNPLGDIWDLFDKRGFIRSPKTGCIASFHLKQKKLDAITEILGGPEDIVLVTGLDYTEQDRIDRLNKKKAPYETWQPLVALRLPNCEVIAKVEELGYPRQALYEKGYPHNNCAGACVLAGISQWVGLYQDDPETFEYAARREKQFQELHKTDFTVLRETRNGERFALSLFELKRRIEADEVSNIRDFRSTCSCMTPE